MVSLQSWFISPNDHCLPPALLLCCLITNVCCDSLDEVQVPQSQGFAFGWLEAGLMNLLFTSTSGGPDAGGPWPTV